MGRSAGIGVNAWRECPVGCRNKFGMTFYYNALETQNIASLQNPINSRYYRDQHPNIATKIKIGVITKNRCNPQLKYPLLYHRHKIVLKLFADGDLLIGDVDVVILYFMELFGIDDIGVVHPHKGR